MPMIRILYGRHYAIEQLFVCPRDQGHLGIARDRTYLILTLKSSVVQTHDPKQVYKAVSKYISQKVQTRPSDYLVSDLWEVRQEGLSTAQTRRLKFGRKQMVTLKRFLGQQFLLRCLGMFLFFVLDYDAQKQPPIMNKFSSLNLSTSAGEADLEWQTVFTPTIAESQGVQRGEVCH